MLTLKHFLLILALIFCINSWCLKTTVNFTSAPDKVDISQDGTLIAVTDSTNNEVTVYDTINFFKLSTYSPTLGVATVARFSRDGAYLAVGADSGDVHLLTIGYIPYSLTFS